MSDVTHILSQVEAGDPTAAHELLPLVYDELRKLAAARMAAERPDHTLQATALVHEAYVRLVRSNVPPNWSSRAHFFGAAAEAMRRILVENARRKSAAMRAEQQRRQGDPDCGSRQAPDAGLELLALHEALDRLAVQHPRTAELVKLRYFAGLTNAQAADALGISARMAYFEWSYARAWLRVAMSSDGPGSS